MLRKLSRRLTYANVMSTIAVFGVLAGGTAYAANTVFSTDIVDGEVKSVDVGNDEIKSADVKDQSLTTFDVSTFLGADVVDNTLTGDDVDESTLNLAAEPWHEVGTAGEPPFEGSASICHWTNYDSNHNSAAFLRDRSGIVHLKGTVEADPGTTVACLFAADKIIFSLPAGYRPALREINVTLTNGALGRLNVNGPAAFGPPAGAVSIDPPATFPNAEEWISLDGISFRCAPSGSNGCP